jgi:hypothetical protein
MKKRADRDVEASPETTAMSKAKLLSWAEAHDARALAIRSRPGVIAATGLVAVLAGVAVAGVVARRSRVRYVRPLRNGVLERIIRSGVGARMAIALAGPALSVARTMWARYKAEGASERAARATRGVVVRSSRGPVRPVANSSEVFRRAQPGAPVGGLLHRARV